jgi:hypothetical protein
LLRSLGDSGRDYFFLFAVFFFGEAFFVAFFAFFAAMIFCCVRRVNGVGKNYFFN